MSEMVQEYVNSGSQPLRVDRAAGVIRGVKLLGLESKNGRRYRQEALVEATRLYEGAKVNVNHPKGHPLSPRDYQDRLGVVRGVQFRAGEGLFGDLHFNPKHALSEQLVWDAEHAPHNVGLSHNVLAQVTRVGEEATVTAITKVQGIDLVADPASTSGLFEHADRRELRVESQEPESSISRPALDSLTLEQLQIQRPDLLRQLMEERQRELEESRREVEELTARVATAERRERIAELLQEQGLPLPRSGGEAAGSIVSEQFVQTLMQAADEVRVRQLIEERAALVRNAASWRESTDREGARPRSRDQLAAGVSNGGGRTRDAAEFVAAIRGG